MAFTFAYTITLSESSVGAIIPVGDGARVIGFPGSNTFNLEPGASVEFSGGFAGDIINIGEGGGLEASLEGTILVITGLGGQEIRIPVPASGEASLSFGGGPIQTLRVEDGVPRLGNQEITGTPTPIDGDAEQATVLSSDGLGNPSIGTFGSFDVDFADGPFVIEESGDASAVRLDGVGADDRIVISDYSDGEIAFQEDADSTLITLNDGSAVSLIDLVGVSSGFVTTIDDFNALGSVQLEIA